MYKTNNEAWCDNCKRFEETYVRTVTEKFIVNGIVRTLSYQKLYCCNCNSPIE